MKTYNLGTFPPVRTKEDIERVAKMVESVALSVILADMIKK